MRTTISALALALSLVGLASCGSKNHTSTPAQTTAVVATRTSSTRLPVGEKATLPDGSTVTVKQGEHPVMQLASGYADSNGNTTYAALVERCAGKANATVTLTNWALFLDDNTQGTNSNGAKMPAFVNATLAPGDCASGWIAFGVTPGHKPQRLQFKSGDTLLVWAAL